MTKKSYRVIEQLNKFTHDKTNRYYVITHYRTDCIDNMRFRNLQWNFLLEIIKLNQKFRIICFTILTYNKQHSNIHVNGLVTHYSFKKIDYNSF